MVRLIASDRGMNGPSMRLHASAGELDTCVTRLDAAGNKLDGAGASVDAAVAKLV